jgi:putative addiction module component (TIGR02574 family)
VAAREGLVIDISALSREQKLDLLERLWDSLTATHEDVPLWYWQRELLDRRLDDLERDGPVGISAEELLRRLRGRNE